MVLEARILAHIRAVESKFAVECFLAIGDQGLEPLWSGKKILILVQLFRLSEINMGLLIPRTTRNTQPITPATG